MGKRMVLTTRMNVLTGALCLFGLLPSLQGCSQSDQATPPAGAASGQASAPAGQPPSDGQGVGIAFQSEPDPPSAGDNTFDVVVTGPDGSPVTDATVSAVFSMPAMPSMNMPAMRTEAPLTHQGAGRYRGTGQLSMSGTWNVIITASRGTEEIGRRTFSVIAK